MVYYTIYLPICQGRGRHGKLVDWICLPVAVDRGYNDIEIFFKALKQNLKIKTFIGTTFNALQS